MSDGQNSFKGGYIGAMWDSVAGLIRLYVRSFDHGSHGLNWSDRISGTSSEAGPSLIKSPQTRSVQVQM